MDSGLTSADGGTRGVSIEELSDQLASPRRFHTACLLVLLHERPGYGYDLAVRLERRGGLPR